MKIRGTAHHIGEKYLQLARDAQSSGDPVMAESYLQHAEHYFRVIAAAQQAQQQAAFGYQRSAGEQAELDDEGDEDFDALPDRFASPAERTPTPPQPVAQQPYAERQPYNNGGQPFEQRQERYQNQQPQPAFDRPDRQQPDRPQQDRSQQDRSYDNRNGRGERNGYQDRAYPNRNGQERNGQERNGQERPGQERAGQERNGQDRQVYDRDASQDRGNQDRGGQERGNQERGAADRGNQDRPRDYDNRGFRNNRGPRETRDNQAREPRQPAPEEPTNGLPAFITAPTRLPVEAGAAQPVDHVGETVTSPEAGDDAFHLRPRRRRRPKAEFAGTEGEAPTPDPVNE